ncbi:EVE domain-containing protein [Pseudohongiella acticola]|uniref:EVE domain-containing protein n=1 Tax=Pseudohongiella acticola TaxID=1524254 RepID=A0A1E8CJI1_9GAMM|nr:EVE domain-containing protein [Pseudohongiella acticola]OFE12568.1 EVE domain-containing protein [Pseudohongiella acticola]
MTRWLVKTEPDECSIDDFARSPDIAIVWEGVRNYQARNFIRDMTVGDEVFVYHSSCKHIGIAGMVTVVRDAYPDPAQFDSKSDYYDAKSTPDNPRWTAVDMIFGRKFPRLITLDELKVLPQLESLALVRKGNRLSVMPVSDDEWKTIVSLC